MMDICFCFYITFAALPLFLIIITFQSTDFRISMSFACIDEVLYIIINTTCNKPQKYMRLNFIDETHKTFQ